MGYLTFVTVAIGLFAGFVLALLAAVSVQDSDGDTGVVGVLVTPLPAAVAAGVWAVVNRFEAGRKWWAVCAVFFGSLAALILMLPWGPPGLLVAMATAGLFGVLARRLLDRPTDRL
jgi:predicted permease